MTPAISVGSPSLLIGTLASTRASVPGDRMDAVSYTHRDVYKRQGALRVQQGQAVCAPLPRLRPDDARHVLRLVPGRGQGHAPVDVYKRQALATTSAHGADTPQLS